ncbi:RNA-binding S4 domain-containing protein [Vibrio sinensis]|uniref:RNA-binding S4 domain-containing protein n=1 Tax=Vibrio sinensis TaxID=2302434 RepID=A0A3A6R3D8_9VIBR|nr:RNA-binding S4 domain-containing protein [Vibrio sinensis]RJX75419.1 RNA-binding S4 domain-containing protein [Vibrio sinensis]
MSDYQTDGEWEEQGEEIEIEAIGIDVSCQPIELYKVFKIANLVGGGGEAKHLISEGYVAVNGELETRKRRKMYDGDFFEFNQEYYVVVCDAPVTEPEESKPKADVNSQPVTNSNKKNKAKNGKASGGKQTDAKQGNAKKGNTPKENTKKGNAKKSSNDKLSAKAEPRDSSAPSSKNKGSTSKKSNSVENVVSKDDNVSNSKDKNGRSSIAFF